MVGHMRMSALTTLKTLSESPRNECIKNVKAKEFSFLSLSFKYERTISDFETA